MVLAVLAATADARAGWSRTKTITNRAVVGPVLAANDRGDAVLAWQEPKSIRVAIRRRDGRFIRSQAIPGADREPLLGDVSAAIDHRGNTIVAWTDLREEGDQEIESCCERLFASVRLRGGRFSRARRLTGQVNAISVQTAIGPRQAAVAHGQDGSGAFASTAPLGQPLPPSQELDRNRDPFSGRGPDEPNLSLSPGGLPRFTYSFPLRGEEQGRVFARSQQPDGVLTDPVELAAGPKLAVGGLLTGDDARGGQVAVWGTDIHDQVAVRGPDERFGPARTLGSRDDRFSEPVLGVAGSGAAAVGIVTHPRGRALGRLRIARRGTGRGFGPLRAVTGAQTEGPPILAVGRQGRMAVAWIGLSGRRFGVRIGQIGEPLGGPGSSASRAGSVLRLSSPSTGVGGSRWRGATGGASG